MDSDTLITKRRIIEDLETGCTPRAEWRIGTEHEKFGFLIEDNSPIPYDGDRSIHKILTSFPQDQWTPIIENQNIIGLKHKTNKSNITLEPAGQLELSGAPLKNLHQTYDETSSHFSELQRITDSMNIDFLGSGSSPKWALSESPIMPKGRYDIMRAYMKKRDKHGLDMMLRSASIQVSLDFDSEADMVKKFRTALALQPIIVALTANSPFIDNKPTGFLSYRSYLWLHTDSHRCGIPQIVFEDGFSFERWVDYLLDVPMYFFYRNSTLINVAGHSFKDFLSGKLPGFPGQLPTLSDWHDHNTTVFSEVRLKNYLEMRGADMNNKDDVCATPALWVGLLYDTTSLSAAWDIIKDWRYEEINDLQKNVAKSALKAKFRNHTVHDLAKEVLAIAHQGLKNRNQTNSQGANETIFLNTIKETAETGITPAERLLEKYYGPWNQNIEMYFKEECFSKL